MKIVVFRAFRDPYRTSMKVYAGAIERRVSPWLAPGETLVVEELPSPRLDGGWRRYWDQYVRYQRYARGHGGDVNHIVDHGYGHLLNSLPPERTIVTFHDPVVVQGPGVNWRTRRAFDYSMRAMRRA